MSVPASRRRGIGGRLLLGLAAALAFGGAPLAAQQAAEADARVSVVFTDVPVATALDRLVAVSGISLVYDADRIGAQRVFCRADAQPAEEVLRCIVREAGLDFYRLSSGTYVVIPTAVAAPRYASLAGRIVDAASGQPIPSARVALDGDGLAREASAAGVFGFARLVPGTYRLSVRAIGYGPVAVQVDVPPDGLVRREFRLERHTPPAAPVIVTGLPSPSRDRPGQRVLARDSLPGALPALAPLVQDAALQLGVAQRALLGDLHVQGGEAGEHQFRLDGMPVYDPVSIGRFFGAFSPLAVERMTIRKAGFGASHGSFSAGVVDLEHRRGGGDAPEGTVSVDPFAVNARGSAPWQLGEVGGSGMLAVRHGIWGRAPTPALARALREWTAVDPLLLAARQGQGTAIAPYLEPRALGGTPSVDFTDAHASLSTDFGGFRRLSVSAFGGTNAAAADAAAVAQLAGTAPMAMTGQDRYRWRQAAGRARYDWVPSARTSAMVQGRVSHLRFVHEQAISDASASGAAPAYEGNGLREVALESSLTRAVGGGASLEAGADLVHTASDFTLGNGVYRGMAMQAAAGRAAGWAQWRQALGATRHLEAGVRFTYLPSRGVTYAEPRVAVEHESPALGWRLAAGAYRQFVNQFDLATAGASSLVPSLRFWLPTDATVAPPLAYHVAGEGVWRPAAAWEFRVEGYAKQQPLILALDYGALLDHGGALGVGQASIIGESRGWAAGAGARVVRDVRPLRVELGYDLGVARRTFPSRFGGVLQPVPWNEPHRALAAVDVRPWRGLEFSARGRGIWGRAWGLRQAYYELFSVGAPWQGVPVDMPAMDRLPPVLELDLGASWERSVGGTSVRAGLGILNALDRRNVLDWWLHPESDIGAGAAFRRVPRAMAGRQVMLSLRIGG